MKNRYFIIPIILISLILLIIKNNVNVINKSYGSINYPFFGDEKIDRFISLYLGDKKDNYIDYDYYKKGNKIYLTFYKYNSFDYLGSESFVLDTLDNSFEKKDIDVFNVDKSSDKKVCDKYVAFTFDDGPNYNTKRVINILNKYNAHATFFVLGTNINGREETLRTMVYSGMEIGNHTFSHHLLTRMEKSDIDKEISTTQDLIFSSVGYYPKIFRPSYGSYNKSVIDVVDMPIIIWNIDTLDWKYHSSKKIYSRVVNKVHDGDIVLMHDIYSSTSNALSLIIPKLYEDGFCIVTVSDLFYYKNINLNKKNVYGKAN